MFIFSATLTLAASSLALAGVLINLDLQRRTIQEANERKAASARAVAPNALASFHLTAQHGLFYNFSFNPNGKIVGFAENSSADSLRISDETIQVFRDLIEHSTNGRLRNHVFELLREHQVLVSRSRGPSLSSGEPERRDNYRHVVHWAYLIALSGLLLSYLRGDDEDLQNMLTARDIQGILHINGMYLTDSSYANYHDHLELYSSRYLRRLGEI